MAKQDDDAPPFADPEFAAKAGRKGGKRSGESRRRKGMKAADVKLRSRDDAERLLEKIAAGVLSKSIASSDANAAKEVVRIYLDALDRAAEEKMAELERVLSEKEAEIGELRRELARLQTRAA